MAFTPHKKTPALIAELKPFDSSNMNGKLINGCRHQKNIWPTGDLRGKDLTDLYRDEKLGINYVVWSYSTPIAWVTNGGTVHLVDTFISAATSRHQSLALNGFRRYEEMRAA